MPQRRHIFGSILLPDAAAVFIERDISEMCVQRYVFLGQAGERRDSAALLLERIPQALGTALLREAVLPCGECYTSGSWWMPGA